MKQPKIENSKELDLFRELLYGAFTKQQSEAVIGMLAKLSVAIGTAQAGDCVQIMVAIRKDKRLKVEVKSAASEQKSHFHKIVLGACRRTHLECLRSAVELNFKRVEQALYRILFTNDQEKVEKVKRMKRIAFGIYRNYYKKILMARATNASSQTFIELQEEFPEVDMQTAVELFSTYLEDKQFRMSHDNIEFIKDILWLSNGKIPNEVRADA
jgi:hypothetical protein